MYRTFFGLHLRPFDLTPDPAYLLLTPSHREALAVLQYGLMSRKGLIVLTGEAGTGKTTLLRAMQADAEGDPIFVTLTNPRLRRDEFVETIVHEFGIAPEAAQSKAHMLRELRALLLQQLAHGRPSALIVDEAHALSDELLEEVRLLANLETDSAKLLTTVLAGQPELADRLNESARWHLKQRVALRCALQPLTPDETLLFVAARIRRAGGDPAEVFTQQAVQACHAHACGIPRLVCVICDNALIAAYAAGEKPVRAARVLEVCRDLDLSPQSAAGRAAHPIAAPASAAPRGEAARVPAGQAPAATRESGAMFSVFSQPRRAWFSR
ncbi:MAG TPA: AAA family ATPase [Vicinamibacterales bacterium]|nr:AAA family ATPase [Vicinamibacterales bacterium]